MQPPVPLQIEPATRPEMPTEAPPPRWSFFTRIGFRFAFAYFIPFCFPFLLGLVTPFFDYPSTKYQAMWNKIIPWVGKHVLRISYAFNTDTTGSGDKTVNYIQIFCLLLLAVIVTLIWSVLDRKRENYATLNRWLRLCVRLALAITLLEYGAYKVIPSQFPSPYLRRLVQPYGESSPMGILWTFMGASKAYTIFAGAVETVGGLLLLFPRLTTLGAMMAVLSMGNVVMLNMSYDVPVKLYSIHYLVMAGLLLLPDLRRLMDVFVFHRPTQLPLEPPFFRRKWLSRGFVALLAVLGLVTFGQALYGSYQQNKFFSTRPELVYGIWTVDEFSLDGEVRPPLLTDSLRWQRVAFDINSAMSWQDMNGKWLTYTLKMDPKKKILSLAKRTDPKWKSELAFAKPAEDAMVLDGQFDGKPLHVKLHRVDEKTMLLNGRGFHWVNEVPFNR
jgi:uncharacterized membrane protein YphA (DoxX/SURF4 family)